MSGRKGTERAALILKDMSRWPKALSKLREARGNQCEYIDLDGIRCDEIDKLQFAHTGYTGLNGEGRGQSRRVMDIKKHPDKYKLVCRYHHRVIDGGKLRRFH